MAELTWQTIPFLNGGKLYLTASPHGLVRVAFDCEDNPVPAGALQGTSSVLDTAARELQEYFSGTRAHFTVPLEWQAQGSVPGFHATVQRALLDIPYGRTWSYSELAAHVGRPSAARAVGTACARNPLPIVVPCHRVTRADGTNGHYLGGAETKQLLIALEQRDGAPAGTSKPGSASK